MSKKMITLIAALIIILFALIMLSFFLRPKNKPTPLTPSGVIPIPTNSPDTVKSNPSPQTSGNTGYSPLGLSQNSQRTSTTKLSPQDQTVFNSLTSSLDGNANVISNSETYQVKYVNPPNELLIEILSTDADQGKLDAINWLKQQGLSNQGVCNLKSVYYLSPQVRSYYQQNNLQFNPVPPGC